MILILSRNDDGNTHLVIEWLIAFKKKFIRLNADDERTRLIYFDMQHHKFIVENNGKKFNLFDATSIWHRRKGLSIKSVPLDQEVYSQEVFFDSPGKHRKHMQTEIDTLISFIYSEVKTDKTLGNYQRYNLNKLKVLAIAEKHGMKIPESYIITRKKDLVEIIRKRKKGVVTKAISDGVYEFTDNYAYYSYTEKISPENITSIPDRFFPSLVQLEVKKKYELRIFYLKGEFYAMAIFSQNDKSTTVDFRKYNKKKPNRTVPYSLPDQVKKKLQAVLDELSLNTGSIDLIVDEYGDYVFLEINPVGQFGMTSAPCNYYLEKKVAEIL